MSSPGNGWIEQPSPFTNDVPALTLEQESQLRASIEPYEVFNDFESVIEGFQNSFCPPYDHTLPTIPAVNADSRYKEPKWGSSGSYNLQNMSPSPPMQQGYTQANIQTKETLDERFSKGEGEDDEDDGQSRKSVKCDRRQKGEVKMINGQLYQREPGWTNFAPAIYHSDIRDELIVEASHGGRLRYPRRRARGSEPTNITSYLAANHDWDEDRDHRPEVCFQYEKRDRTTPEYEPGLWIRGGKFVIDHSSRRMQMWRNLPLTISSEESGMFLEAWRREDSRIGLDDMMARMPRDFLKGTKRRGIYGVSTINMRMNRFRINACIKSWNPRVGTPTIDAYLDYLLPKECHTANSTRGFRNLTKAESAIAWMLNKGSRQYNMSDITDEERTKRMKAYDTRIKKLIEQDHKRGIMTVYMTRDELSDRVGPLHIPPVTTGVYKSKRKAVEDAAEEGAEETETRPQIKRQKSMASATPTKGKQEGSAKHTTKSLSLKRSASSRLAPVTTRTASAYPAPPPVTPSNATRAQLEYPTIPNFDETDFSIFNSFPENQRVTTGNVGDWLANDTNFQDFPPLDQPGIQSWPMQAAHNPSNAFSKNAFTTPSYNATPQIQCVSSTNVSPFSRSPNTSPSTQAPTYLTQNHRPTNANEVRAIYQALEPTRQHIKSYFGHDIELPAFNPNENYASQYTRLLECFKGKWASVYGEGYAVPKLDGMMPAAV